MYIASMIFRKGMYCKHYFLLALSSAAKDLVLFETARWILPSLASQTPIRIWGGKRGLVTPRTRSCNSGIQ